jgi:hypothetical protein
LKKVETKFKEKVLSDLKTLNTSWFFKTQERGRRGVLDIIACLNGGFCSIELKTDNGKLDRLQEYVIGEIRQAKGFAIATTPSKWPQHFELIKELFYK